MAAAAVSGVTYKSSSRDRWFEAASLLRTLADQIEEDGLAGLGWGYRGNFDARQAWRPDIRSEAGLAELDQRTDAVIEGMMRPLRALTVPQRRAIVCMSFVRMALSHVEDLIAQEPDAAAEVRDYALSVLRPHTEKISAAEQREGSSGRDAAR